MEEHKNLNEADMVTDLLVGMSDGLILPFALVTGLSVVIPDTNTIITIGVVATMVGAIGMGLSRFYAGRFDAEHHAEEGHSHHHIDEIDLTHEERVAVAGEMQHDKEKWKELVTSYELDKFNPKIARDSARNISLSYILAGLIPLTPYLVFSDRDLALKTSIAVTVIGLFVFGYLKARVTGLNGFVGAGRSVIMGCTAAAAIFVISRIFS